MAVNDSQRPDRPEAGPPWEQTFVANMQALRERRQMTQTDLAKRLKDLGLPFHQQTIQRIENGDRPVRLNEAYLIAQELGLDLGAMTSAMVPSSKSVSWSMSLILDAAHDTTEAVYESYDLWILAVANQFTYDLETLLNSEEYDKFEDLPQVLKFAVAFCGKIIETAAAFKEAVVQLASFSMGEGSSYVPPMEVIEQMKSWIEKYDCRQLSELINNTKAHDLVRSSSHLLYSMDNHPSRRFVTDISMNES